MKVNMEALGSFAKEHSASEKNRVIVRVQQPSTRYGLQMYAIRSTPLCTQGVTR